jgi:replicative DNA helicase
MNGPYSKLFDNWDGIHNGSHYLFAAQPSCGKTASIIEMIIGLVTYNLENDLKIYLYSFDDDARKILKTILGTLSRMRRNKVDRNIETNPRSKDLFRAYNTLLDWYDAGRFDVLFDFRYWEDLEADIYQKKKQHENVIFFIDGPYKLKTLKKIFDKDEKMNFVPDTIHSICKNYDVPIILTAELGKAAFGRPQMSSVKGSGAWVYNASGIAVMYPDPDYHGSEKKHECNPDLKYVNIDCVKDKNNGWEGAYNIVIDKEKTQITRREYGFESESI